MHKTSGKQKQYEPTPVDNLILQYVREYHFLTARLLVQLHFSKGSLERAQRKLKLLSETGFLDRRRMPHIGVGNPEYIYYLATKGQRYLIEQGFDGFTRVRPKDITDMTYPHLQHVLDLNEVLIAARLLNRFVPEITLTAMQHDLDLKKTPAKVSYVRRLPDGDKDEETATIVPDAWLDFRLSLPNTDKKRRKCIVLELDRGTISMGPFKQKLRAYVHYALENGPYYRQFGTNAILVAYATTAGQERLKAMLAWCEDELHQQRLDHEAELFRFTAFSADKEIDPRTLFCEPVWYIPYEQKPITLLWKP